MKELPQRQSATNIRLEGLDALLLLRFADLWRRRPVPEAYALDDGQTTIRSAGRGIFQEGHQLSELALEAI